MTDLSLLPVEEPHPSRIPGGLQEHLVREIPGLGTIEFEYAPVGYLKKTKPHDPRLVDWRAYYFTPENGKRRQIPSVTTWLGQILPKDLSRYGEEHGARGVHFLHQHGELTAEHTEEDAVEMVRARKLGVDAATNRAASRGINVHSVLEHYMRHGSFPSVPLDLAGYVRGLQDWVRAYEPEPQEVELLVCDPDRGYAGRMDLRAVTRSKAMPTRAARVVDLKTAPKLSIWPGAHAQTRAYAMADRVCGGPETDTPIIVVVDAEGCFDVVDCDLSEEGLAAALAWYRFAKPLAAGCEARHYALRKAA